MLTKFSLIMLLILCLGFAIHSGDMIYYYVKCKTEIKFPSIIAFAGLLSILLVELTVINIQ